MTDLMQDTGVHLDLAGLFLGERLRDAGDPAEARRVADAAVTFADEQFRCGAAAGRAAHAALTGS